MWTVYTVDIDYREDSICHFFITAMWTKACLANRGDRQRCFFTAFRALYDDITTIIYKQDYCLPGLEDVVTFCSLAIFKLFFADS